MVVEKDRTADGQEMGIGHFFRNHRDAGPAIKLASNASDLLVVRGVQNQDVRERSRGLELVS